MLELFLPDELFLISLIPILSGSEGLDIKWTKILQAYWVVAIESCSINKTF